MKERPIIMSADSVRAILEGRKAQTRRVVKPTKNTEWLLCDDWDDSYIINPGNHLLDDCPFGQVGDGLWVREVFAPFIDSTTRKQGAIYKADGTGLLADQRWKSPIFMPRWVSRILLEITDIRVERLQDISEEDIRKEGILESEVVSIDCNDYESWYLPFMRLWDSINAKRGHDWLQNSFVWVISFKIIQSGKYNEYEYEWRMLRDE